MNFLDARVENRSGLPVIALGRDSNALGVPARRQEALKALTGQALRFGMRPEDVRLERASADDAEVRARIVVVEPLGAETLVTLASPGGELVARITPREGLRAGEDVPIFFDMAKFHAFDCENGAALPTA